MDKKYLCYHCDEKWGLGHVCKKSKVYLLQMEGSNVEEECSQLIESTIEVGQTSSNVDDDQIEVSLHALSGSISTNAMKLLGKMGSFVVEILVDLGSIHNFLDPIVVNTFKVKVAIDSIMQVRVANGESIFSKGTFQEKIIIQVVKFVVPFHILSLGGFDIELGVWWLKTLGSITWTSIKCQ